MKTVQINALAGIRNDVSTERFTRSDLLVGKNIDVDETGKAFRRLGVHRLATGAHSSLWSENGNTFYVKNNALFRLLPDMSSVQIATGIAANVSYTHLAGKVFLSDGIRSLVVQGDQVTAWGVEPPASTFAVQSAAGDMPAGTYGVTVVFVRRDGYESGAPSGQFIELGAHSAITLTNLPVSTNPHVTHKRVYLTRPNGELFFEAATLRNDVLTTTLRALPPDALPLRTQFKGAAPAGSIVGSISGQSFVASGSVLAVSDPHEPELFDLRYGFVQFGAPITMVAPVSDGVYVGTTEETVFLNGFNVSEWQLQRVANYGVVPGTLVYPDNNQVTQKGIQNIVAMWFSQRGVCIGASSGEMVNLTSSRFVAPSAKAGAGLFKVRGGTPQYLVSLYS